MEQRTVKRMMCVWCMSLLLNACAVEDMGTLQQGRLLEEQGDYKGAMENYQQMADPDFAQVCSDNLRVLYGDIAHAMRETESTPDNAEAFYALGHAYYEKASSLPEEFEVENNFGFDTKSYFSERRATHHTRSITALNSATQLQPDNVRALYLKGRNYEDTQNSAGAIDTYQRVLNLQPTFPEASLRLGNLLYKRGNTEEGRELAEKVVNMAPELSDAHLLLGTMYAQEGRDDQAITQLQEALCSNEYSIDAYHRLSQVYLAQGQVEEAERVLSLGRVKNPDSLFISIRYSALKSILDQQELDRFIKIMRNLVGEVSERLLVDASKGKSFEPSAGLEIQYLRLQQDFIRRRRPYFLPCSGDKEDPFFENQIAKVQKKIDEFMQQDESQENVVSP